MEIKVSEIIEVATRIRGLCESQPVAIDAKSLTSAMYGEASDEPIVGKLLEIRQFVIEGLSLAMILQTKQKTLGFSDAQIQAAYEAFGGTKGLVGVNIGCQVASAARTEGVSCKKPFIDAPRIVVRKSAPAEFDFDLGEDGKDGEDGEDDDGVSEAGGIEPTCDTEHTSRAATGSWFAGTQAKQLAAVSAVILAVFAVLVLSRNTNSVAMYSSTELSDQPQLSGANSDAQPSDEGSEPLAALPSAANPAIDESVGVATPTIVVDATVPDPQLAFNSEARGLLFRAVPVIPGELNPWGLQARDSERLVQYPGYFRRVLSEDLGGGNVAVGSSLYDERDRIAQERYHLSLFQLFALIVQQDPDSLLSEPERLRLANDPAYKNSGELYARLTTDVPAAQ